MGTWRVGEQHYGCCCAAALHDDNVELARSFAARAHICHRRYIAAWIRMMTQAAATAPVTDLDWFGEGDA